MTLPISALIKVAGGFIPGISAFGALLSPEVQKVARGGISLIGDTVFSNGNLEENKLYELIEQLKKVAKETDNQVDDLVVIAIEMFYKYRGDIK